MNPRRPRVGGEPGAELAAAAVQGRFHGPDRDAGLVGDLLVIQTFTSAG